MLRLYNIKCENQRNTKRNHHHNVNNTVPILSRYYKINILYQFIDSFIICFLIGSLCISFWRGTWQLFDLFVVPNNFLLSALVSFGIGAFFLINTHYFQSQICSIEEKIKSYVMKRLFRIIYIYFHSNFNVLHWRGFWNIIDHIFGRSLLSAIIGGLIAIVLSIIHGTIIGLISAPFTCLHEGINSFHNIPLFFKTNTEELKKNTNLNFLMLENSESDIEHEPLSKRKIMKVNDEFCFGTNDVELIDELECVHQTSSLKKSSTFKDLLNSLYTILIIHSIIILGWRSLWLLIDYLYFNEKITKSFLNNNSNGTDVSSYINKSLDVDYVSSIISGVIGYTSFFFLIVIQEYVLNINWKVDNKIFMRISTSIYLLTCFFSSINIWRFVWNMFNIYFLSSYQVLSLILSHLIGIIGLIFLRYSASLLVRGSVSENSFQRHYFEFNNYIVICPKKMFQFNFLTNFLMENFNEDHKFDYYAPVM
ncbi:hypothetical protein SNEBB_003650 [Seison nebaliae]|nr:hypothetical protein SNEBB_003650 [Seison nebaliae]